MMSAPVAISLICFLLGWIRRSRYPLPGRTWENRPRGALQREQGDRDPLGGARATGRWWSWPPTPSFIPPCSTRSPPSWRATTASSATTIAAPASRPAPGPTTWTTGAGDLAAVIEASGGAAVIVGLGDAVQPRRSGLRRAARARRGDRGPGRHARRTEEAGGLRGDGLLRHGRQRLPQHVRDRLSRRASLPGHRRQPADERGGDPRAGSPAGRVPAPGDGGGPAARLGGGRRAGSRPAPAATGSGCCVRTTWAAAGFRRAGRPASSRASSSPTRTSSRSRTGS